MRFIAHSPKYLLGALLVFGCFAPRPSIAETKLRVGVALPLTGMAADYGLAYKKGLELALADKPDPGNSIELIFEDHKYDSKTAVSAAQKLLHLNKVDVLAVWGWAPSDAIAPLSKEAKTPMLLSSINPISKDRPRVFNLASPLGHLMQPLSDRILADKVTEIAFVNTPVGALQQGVAEMQTQLGDGVKTIDNISVPPEASDFRSTITKLKGKSTKNLALFLLPAQIKTFLQQAHALKFHPRLYGGNTFNDALVRQAIRSEDQPPVFVDWITRTDFEMRLDAAKLVESHRVEAAQGYFLGSVLLSITVKARPYTPESISDTIYYLPGGDSPAGEYSTAITDFGWHVLFPAAIYTIRDGIISRE